MPYRRHLFTRLTLINNYYTFLYLDDGHYRLLPIVSIMVAINRHRSSGVMKPLFDGAVRSRSTCQTRCHHRTDAGRPSFTDNAYRAAPIERFPLKTVRVSRNYTVRSFVRRCFFFFTAAKLLIFPA